MNKELEEAVEWLRNNIKYYQEQLKIISALDDSDYYDEETTLYENRIKIFKTVLNHIENSISKEVIKDNIEEYKEIADEDNKEYFIKIETLEELLEGK